MKCGALGHKTALGKPCDQNIPASAKGCLWHTASPARRRLLATKGSLAARMNRALPRTYRVIPFESREAVIRFVEDLAQRVLTADVDRGRIDTALRAASVALSGFAQQTQERLVEALLKVEHGGAAVLLLQQFTDGHHEGRRRPLPGRIASLPVAAGETS